MGHLASISRAVTGGPLRPQVHVHLVVGQGRADPHHHRTDRRYYPDGQLQEGFVGPAGGPVARGPPVTVRPVREALEPGAPAAVATRRRPSAGRLTPLLQGPGEGAGQARELLIWAGLVALGLALTAVAVAVSARVGSPGAPFTGRFRFKVSIGSLLAPATAVTVLAAVRMGMIDRLRWGVVVGGSYLAALWWAMSLALVDGGNGFAAPIASPTEYLRDVPAVGSHPGHFVRTFIEQAPHYSVATRTHPPGPVLLLWALGKLGIHRPEVIGIVITVLGMRVRAAAGGCRPVAVP